MENPLESISDIKDVRKLFPIVNSCVYLNSAHYSQYSLETNKRLMTFIDEFTYSNKNLNLFANSLKIRLKEKIARLIMCEKEDVIIVSNTTHGLNIFANGVTLAEVDSVAYLDCEFPAVAYTWMNQNRIRGIRNIVIPTKNFQIDTKEIIESLKTNNVKVLTISSVEFLGFRNDLEILGSFCKENNIYFVVDAIQSIGAVPMDVKKYNIDFLSAGAQKWMMSPSGVGFAYISPAIRDFVKPTYIGTSSINYNNEKFLDYRLDFMEDGSAYEISTLNCLGMIGLESSLDLFLKLGINNIFIHISRLIDLFISELKESNFVVFSDMSEIHRSNILLFSHKNMVKNKEINQNLEKNGVFISLREGYLRLSPHLFNNENEILFLLNELKKY